ncbi:DUF5105 domain-containing protein [Priestia koreensis]|uniref:DUF4352 domain-containing protein n=1 Tax=Priestia koreensis TaxID=284581 RepID=A0A0M0KP46_9BACI|nr:DUF5105 domain-containing protein [Priestia koreensis]KOO40382.1 hypothetical protein AMD01_21215 [Priestia koreensis]
MIKKVSLVALLGASMLTLAACGDSETSSGSEGGKKKGETASAKSEIADVKIDDVKYILTGNEESVDEESALLQVKLKVKNTSKKDISLSSYDGIKLYSGEDQIEPYSDSISSDLEESAPSRGDIRPGRATIVPVLFEVEKGKKYELSVEPTSSDYNQKSKEMTFKVDTKKYEDSYDKLQEPSKALQAYVETVYFDKDNADYEKYVSADKEAVKAEAQKEFNNLIKDTMYKVRPTEADFAKYYNSYKQILAQKGKVEAQTVGNVGDKAIVTLKYTSVPLRLDFINGLNNYQTEYRRNVDAYNSEKAEAYALSKFDTVLESIEPIEARDTLKVLLVKKDGKWTVEKSKYGRNLSEIFAHGSVY